MNVHFTEIDKRCESIIRHYQNMTGLNLDQDLNESAKIGISILARGNALQYDNFIDAFNHFLKDMNINVEFYDVEEIEV